MSDNQARPGDAAKTRPKNREVENEMIRPPAAKGKPPRSATDPHGNSEGMGDSKEGAAPPGNIHEVRGEKGKS